MLSEKTLKLEVVALYGFLGRLFLEEPSRKLVRAMVEGKLKLPYPKDATDELERAIREWNEFMDKYRGKDLEITYQELAAEYAFLFIGPRPRNVHPYESVYRDTLTIGGQTFKNLLMGESVDKVHTFWLEAGVRSVHSRNYPPDHVGLELSFMAYVGQKYLENGSNTYLTIARKFLKEHLLHWVPQFCNDLMNVLEAHFYKIVAQLTKALLNYHSLLLENEKTLRKKEVK